MSAGDFLLGNCGCCEPGPLVCPHVDGTFWGRIVFETGGATIHDPSDPSALLVVIKEPVLTGPFTTVANLREGSLDYWLDRVPGLLPWFVASTPIKARCFRVTTKWETLIVDTTDRGGLGIGGGICGLEHYNTGTGEPTPGTTVATIRPAWRHGFEEGDPTFGPGNHYARTKNRDEGFDPEHPVGVDQQFITALGNRGGALAPFLVHSTNLTNFPNTRITVEYYVTT